MTVPSRFPLLALLCILVTVAGCGDDDDPVVPAPDDGVRYGADVQPIFTASCTPGCHSGSSPNGGLDLSAGASHDQLVGVAALNYPGRTRVIAGDPDDSLLYLKLIGDPDVGNQMPLNPAFALDEEQIDTVRQWIVDGARDD